jgi:hypothetical protein
VSVLKVRHAGGELLVEGRRPSLFLVERSPTTGRAMLEARLLVARHHERLARDIAFPVSASRMLTPSAWSTAVNSLALCGGTVPWPTQGLGRV